VDFCDAHIVCATGTPVLAGPPQEEVTELGRLLGKTGRLKSMDVVELNPDIGSPREVRDSFKLTADFIRVTLRETFQTSAESVRCGRSA